MIRLILGILLISFLGVILFGGLSRTHVIRDSLTETDMETFTVGIQPGWFEALFAGPWTETYLCVYHGDGSVTVCREVTGNERLALLKLITRYQLGLR